MGSHTFSTLPGMVSRFSYISNLAMPGLMQSQQRKASGAGRMDWLDGALNIVRSGFLALGVVVGYCCGCCLLLLLGHSRPTAGKA